jgi:tripartite ATP-independent transporter DctP family solute receptor
LKRTKILTFLIGFLLIVVLASGVVSAEDNYILRLGHNNAVNHPLNKGALQFAERVKERTNGKVIIEVYPAAQLGDERQLGEALQLGTIDLMGGVTSMVGQFVPEFLGFEAGYLFRDRDHQTKVHRGEIGEELNQKLIDSIGVRVLTYFFAGDRHLTTKGKPVYHPSDLEGMLIRVPQLENSMVTMKSMGANVTGIAFNEVYMALKMGVADGQENPISSIYAMKFYEVQDYLSLTGHIISNGIYVMNNDKFTSMLEEYQKIILEEAQKAGDYAGSIYASEAEELLPILEKSLTVIEVDRSEFREYALSHGMDEWYTEVFGADLYNRIKNVR